MGISKNSADPSLLEKGKGKGLRSDDSYSRVRLVGAVKARVFRDALIYISVNIKINLCHFGRMTKVRDKKLIRDFGKHLKAIRLESGMSQEDLANDAAIPINQIGRIERGEINSSRSTIASIAKALNLKLHELVKF
jgi:DNA-binding XRE family transcriptional regulator